MTTSKRPLFGAGMWLAVMRTAFLLGLFSGAIMGSSAEYFVDRLGDYRILALAEGGVKIERQERCADKSPGR